MRKKPRGPIVFVDPETAEIEFLFWAYILASTYVWVMFLAWVFHW